MEVSSPSHRYPNLHVHRYVSSLSLFIFFFVATNSLSLLLLSALPSQAEAAEAIKLTSTSTSSSSSSTTRRIIRRTPRFPVPRTGVWGPPPVPVPVPVPDPIPVDREQQGGPLFSILSPQEETQLQQEEKEQEREEGEREKGEGGREKEVVKDDAKGDDDRDHQQKGEDTNLLTEYVFETKYYTQVLDHFSFERSDERFQQRYLVNDKHWDKENGGPIFMYCGNEGGIEAFVYNTGFMWDIAPEFGAMLLFVEHRYYGQSMPFGSTDIALKNASTLGYLSAEQAIADFATLLVDLKRNLTAEENPVVLFGGSYGGMLAAWMRLKYPHIAVGAIASSAPILQFEDLIPADTYDRIASADFKMESETCFERIRDSWGTITEMGMKDGGLDELTKRFRLCKKLDDVQKLKNWIDTAFGELAMVNYPMPTSFLMPLPAYPIREVCKRIDNAPRGSDLLARIFAGVSIFYNYTGGEKCFDVDTQSDVLGTDAWAYQTCTEMVMPFASNPNNSMFEPFDWDQKAYIKSCQDDFGVTPRPNWITTQYATRDIKTVLKHFGSNIVFSNGLLDPWSGGCVLEDISSTLVAINIPDGAHHLDLRAATPDDPQSVVMQRKAEKVHIRAWLREFHAKKHGFFFGARMTFTMAGFGTIVCGLVGAVVAVAVIQTAVRRRRRRWAQGDFNPGTGLDRLAEKLIEGEEKGQPRDLAQPWP